MSYFVFSRWLEIPQLEKGESFVVKPDLRFQISGFWEEQNSRLGAWMLPGITQRAWSVFGL